LRYAPLPGGDLAAREPWRVALGYLSLEENARSLFRLAFDGIDASETAAVRMQLDRKVNTPLASAMGRLFDAASALLGVRQYATFEGQAAMELESLAGSIPAPPLEFPVTEENGSFVLDPLPLLISLGDLRCRGGDVCELAARFHESVVRTASSVAAQVAAINGLDTIALGGGSFQNARLLSGIRSRLESRGLRVLTPRLLGPNDGAISYGQAAIAAALLSRGD
jgi:hydrogenase maturation protein HypF